MTGTWTIDELLVWTLAREAHDDDVVVVGVATPIATTAALLARATVAPSLTVIVAATVSPEIHDVAGPMLDPAMLDRIGAGTLGQAEILDQIQKGVVTVQYVSPAQVDGAGRLNTSRVKKGDGSWLRLPGGLATADIAVLMGRLVAYRADHSPRFLPARVDFVTGAGHDGGESWRTDRRLPGAGVQAIVTDKAVLRWVDDHFEAASVHPGVDLDDVVTGAGFPLKVADDADVTPGPPAEPLEILRTVIDPHGLRRLEIRATRAEALAELDRIARRPAARTPPSGGVPTDPLDAASASLSEVPHE